LHYIYSMDIKRGAPPKPPNERKANVIQIRLTDAEKAECELAARTEDTKMSTWARRALVKAANRCNRKKSGNRTRSAQADT